MNKQLAIVTGLILVVSSWGAIMVSGDDFIKESVFIPKPEVRQKDGMLQIYMKDAQYARRPGLPILPFYQKIYILPFGAEVDVTCTEAGYSKLSIDGEFTTPHPFFTSGNNTLPAPEIGEHKWYTSRITAGLKSGNRVNFLTLTLYPVRFDEGGITFVTKYDITINYDSGFYTEIDAYDMLIICPQQYTFAFNFLASHREQQGISTKLVSLSEIYGGAYFEAIGKDDAEMIKYFIKNAADTWGITYVLLVGDLNDLPSRTVYAAVEEESFTSDLYYADIFDAQGDFSSWDPNDNGFYGEYNHSGNKEIIDMYPDVNVARIPCRNILEAFLITAKLINYDSLDKQGWFDRFVVVAGDSFDDSLWGTDYIEGEITTAKSIEYMPDFEPVKLWATLGTLTEDNIINEFNQGAGFIHLDGHGNYLSWASHPVHDYRTWIGIDVQDMPKIFNIGKPAVVLVGGCHTGELGQYYECISYRLLRKLGGAIASIGYTSLSWGADDDVNGNGQPDIIEYASGYLNTLFFKKYGIEHIHTLGDVWSESITEYLLTAPVEWNDEYLDIWDARTVEAWQLFGDPSLLIE